MTYFSGNYFTLNFMVVSEVKLCPQEKNWFNRLYRCSDRQYDGKRHCLITCIPCQSWLYFYLQLDYLYCWCIKACFCICTTGHIQPARWRPYRLPLDFKLASFITMPIGLVILPLPLRACPIYRFFRNRVVKPV